MLGIYVIHIHLCMQQQLVKKEGHEFEGESGVNIGGGWREEREWIKVIIIISKLKVCTVCCMSVISQ